MTRIAITFFFILLNFSLSIAQKQDYAKEWLAIEQLEVDGKITSALKEVTKLQEKASRQKNNEQLLKTLLFRWKFKQIIDEKSQVSILEELKTEIEKQAFPTKQLLHMYMAHFLESYLNDNYWRINNRTATENATINNYATWDLNTFLIEISSHYDKALKPQLALANIPTKNVTELLVTVPISRKYKPTLYDIIAHKALKFYTNSRNRINKPKDEFLIDSEDYFASSLAFSKSKLTTTDTTSLLFKALTTYQQLELIHSQQKNTSAWVKNTLSRLEFIKNNHIGSETNQLHIKSLQNLLTEFDSSKDLSKIEVTLAQAYRNAAFTKNDSLAYKYPNYNSLALNLCKKIEKSDANTETRIKALNLKNQILQKKTTWLTQNKYLPNKPHLAKVTFLNSEKITINAYQVPHDFSINELDYNKRNSVTKAYLSKRKLHFSKSYTLPTKKDYNSYSTEVIVPKLPLGKYIFRIQTDTLTESFEYHEQYITELSLNKTDTNKDIKYQVLNRYNGSPIANANILVKTALDRRNREYSTTKYTTNDWGEFHHRKGNRYEQNQIIVQTKADTLQIGDYNYQRNNNKSTEIPELQTKVLLFLDRAIYRPNQPVYFKTIGISNKGEITSVLKNKDIYIEFNDPTGEIIFEKVVTTNEFGSAHGSFKLPESGITGEFSAEAYLDDDTIDSDDEDDAEIYFSVEEYKRPTFEVSFTPLTKVYKPLDSIKAIGNAKAFLGSSITDAEVVYSVKRTTTYTNWWYRSYPTNNESKQLASGTVKTDADGNFSIPFKAETDTQDTTDKIYNYTIEAKVTDLNGETREATTIIKVADKNLIATINTPETWNSCDSTKVTLNTTDVNGNPITTTGTLKIYKLKSSGRFLNDRPWTVPDIQIIDEASFKTQFPHLPFSDEKDPKNWKKGQNYFKHTYSNKKTAPITLDGIKKWPAGKYILVASATDPVTKATSETQKIITLNHSSQQIPADEEVFVHSIDFDSKKPNKIILKMQTATPKLQLFVELFDGDRSIWKNHIELKKGTETRTIKLPKLNFPNVTAQYHYQIYNHLYTVQDDADFSPESIILNIEKKHFTDKISPGAQEKWSFSLKSSNNKEFNAEALASMYDASLDQFTRQSWNTSFGFGKSIPRPSTVQEIHTLSTISTNYTKSYYNLTYPKITLEHLNLYGFDFNIINSLNYRSYLEILKHRLSFKINEKFDKNASHKVTGLILDEDGNAIPSVDIIIKGTEYGTISNFNGEFTVKANIGDTLEISSIGYELKQVVITRETKTVKVVLKISESSSLSEITVVGYGSVQKRELTGAVTSITSKKLKSYDNAESSDFTTALQGRVAGVQVTTSSPKTKDNTPTEDLKDLQNIKARTNLQETAFFLPNLRTNKKGEIEFEFTAPEALTRWNFRMLAHTQQAKTGSFNAQTLTQKELSIIPNAPRFVREGDSLHFTAKIANLTNEQMTGTALLEWSDPVTNKPINSNLNHTQTTQNFSIDANGNSLVSWTIAIPEGLTAIQYKIVAKAGNFTDGEEKIIPVLSNRMLVTESIPIWVRAGETETYSLANFDASSSSQKPHAITLEYTSNPAWLAIKSLPYLIEFPHECSEQTFSRLYANTMAAHILNSQPKIKAVFDSWTAKGTLKSPLETNAELKNILLSESPWLQESRSETEQQQRLAELFDLVKTAKEQEKAINKLRQLQKSSGGFPWFQGGYESTYITRHILAGFGHLEKLGVTNQRTKTDNMVKNMIRYLDRELLKDYKEYLKRHKTPDNFYKQVGLLHFAYARSFYKGRFPLKGEVKEIITKALAFQKTDWQSRTIYEKGLLALVLHRLEKSAVTQQILTALTESAVNSKENGMYWKRNTNSWWWYQSAISTQALLIEAFSETAQPKKLLEELKIFLLKNKRTNRWETTIETADATYALLLQGSDWLSVKDNTVIEVGGQKIATKKLTETEKEQGTGYLKTRWNATEITPKFKAIKVSNNSKVTNYGGYYWQYFETLDNIKTDENSPLAIKKELYKKVTTDKGTELKVITPATSLQVGDKVTVRLLVKSDDDMEYVHLKDMRASGFEPVSVLSGYQYKELRYYQSTKDVATHFFIDRLPKGNYVLEYDVIANQIGSFSNGITQLQCMYAPEFSSHSAGQRVEIEK